MWKDSMRADAKLCNATTKPPSMFQSQRVHARHCSSYRETEVPSSQLAYLATWKGLF